MPLPTRTMRWRRTRQGEALQLARADFEPIDPRLGTQPRQLRSLPQPVWPQRGGCASVSRGARRLAACRPVDRTHGRAAGRAQLALPHAHGGASPRHLPGEVAGTLAGDGGRGQGAHRGLERRPRRTRAATGGRVVGALAARTSGHAQRHAQTDGGFLPASCAEARAAERPSHHGYSAGCSASAVCSATLACACARRIHALILGTRLSKPFGRNRMNRMRIAP